MSEITKQFLVSVEANDNIKKQQSILVASFPGSPCVQTKNAFLYCKQRKAGRGLGTRLGSLVIKRKSRLGLLGLLELGMDQCYLCELCVPVHM